MILLLILSYFYRVCTYMKSKEGNEYTNTVFISLSIKE